ncbi:MAG: hypothetical protein JW986_04240 [Methanotrichaceae archaeon]|nr:hypothetical protein [Methanotrichaceae archaeon]
MRGAIRIFSIPLDLERGAKLNRAARGSRRGEQCLSTVMALAGIQQA